MTGDDRAAAIRKWAEGQEARFGGQTSRGVTIEDVDWLLSERDRLTAENKRLLREVIKGNGIAVALNDERHEAMQRVAQLEDDGA